MIVMIVLVLIVVEEPNRKDRCAVTYLLGIVVLLLVILYYVEKRLTARLPVLGILRFLIIHAGRRNVASVVCEGPCKPSISPETVQRLH